MMKKSFLLLVLLCLCIPAHAQSYRATIDAAIDAATAKQFAQAAQLFQDSLKLAVTDADRYYSLTRGGESLKEAGKPEAARELWGKALKLPALSFEDEVATRIALASSFYNQDQWSQSRQEWQRIVDKLNASAQTPDKSKQLPLALFMLGQSNYREGNTGGATKAYQQILDVNGVEYIQALTAVSALGDAESKAGANDLAVQWWRQVISFAQRPEVIQIDNLRQASQLKLAGALLAQKKYAEAKEEFLRVVYWPNVTAERLEAAKQGLREIEKAGAPKTP